MAWFKVDDKLHSHKKAARAGEAMCLWVLAGSWCADQLTDGFVPDYIVSRIVPDGLEMADRLVKAGLWFVDEFDGDEGWRFKDWTEYQPTRDEVESKREYERDKKRKQRRDPKGQFAPSPDMSPGDNLGESPGESTRPVPSRPDPKEEPSSAVADPEVSQEARTLTRQFALAVKANGFPVPGEGQKNRAKWLEDMDKLLRLGAPGGEPSPQDATEVAKVIDFATTDGFWKANVRSPAKFREQYPTLRLRMLNQTPALGKLGTGGVAL